MFLEQGDKVQRESLATTAECVRIEGRDDSRPSPPPATPYGVPSMIRQPFRAPRVSEKIRIAHGQVVNPGKRRHVHSRIEGPRHNNQVGHTDTAPAQMHKH